MTDVSHGRRQLHATDVSLRQIIGFCGRQVLKALDLAVAGASYMWWMLDSCGRYNLHVTGVSLQQQQRLIHFDRG